MEPNNLWVFGYGSLIWNPGFEFKKLVVGHIKGYARKFYQGSDEHRGSPDRLGRVATLIEDKNAETWGLSFLIANEDEASEYLKQRESSIGGYETKIVEFFPKNPLQKSFSVRVYIALPNNRLFLGTSPLAKIANDIAFSRGSSGHNVEYLSKLLAFMKVELPNIQDDHLFTLEIEVKRILKEHNLTQLDLFKEAIDSWLINSVFDRLNDCEDIPTDNHVSNHEFNYKRKNHSLRCLHKC